MFHYFNSITNTSGDALVGYFVKAISTTSNDVVDIYADSSGTAIDTVSGVANAAVVNANGMVDFWIPGGTYHLDIYATDGTQFVERQEYVQMVDFARVSGSIDPREYGMGSGNPSTDLVSLQNAVNAAASSGRALFIPRDLTPLLRVNGTVTIPNGGIDIVGGGTIYSTADAPLFSLDGGSLWRTYSDFRVVFELTSAPSAACAIKLNSPSGTNYIQYNTFDNIITVGAIAAIRSTSATRTTSSGEESAVNWNTFRNIRNFADDNVAGSARNVIWFESGSGTGNVYSELKGRLGATASSYVRMDGSGCVVGDIIIIGGHFDAVSGGAVDCAVFEYGTGTVYRTNIQVMGCQSDANMTRVFRLASGGVAPANIYHDGGLVGGSVVLGINVPINTMRISDRDAGLWQGGGTWSVAATGLQTIPFLKATLQTYSAVRVKLTITGIVDGVSAGSAEIVLALKSDGTTTTVTSVSSSVDPSGLFAVTSSVSGLAATLNLTFTPSTSGTSSGYVTWQATGNRIYLQRLP